MIDWIWPADPALFAHGTAEDPRLGARVARVGLPELVRGDAPDVVLVGVPDDRGVVAGGGRAGADEGPTELRRQLYKLTPGMHGELDRLRIGDLGNVQPASSVADTHERLAGIVERIVAAGSVAIVVGGGHDHAYGSSSGVVRALGQKTLRLVTVDTHLDVRPLKDGVTITSGTPFRRLLEAHDRQISLAQMGMQPQHNAAAHLAWAEERGAEIHPLATVRTAGGAGAYLNMLLGQHPAAAVSLDLDCAAGHVAPGVSAPPADGFSAADVLDLCRWAGKHPGTHLLDVMELAPRLDIDARTARLAAAAVWQFMAGVAARHVPSGGY